MFTLRNLQSSLSYFTKYNKNLKYQCCKALRTCFLTNHQISSACALGIYKIFLKLPEREFTITCNANNGLVKPNRD